MARLVWRRREPEAIRVMRIAPLARHVLLLDTSILLPVSERARGVGLLLQGWVSNMSSLASRCSALLSTHSSWGNPMWGACRPEKVAVKLSYIHAYFQCSEPNHDAKKVCIQTSPGRHLLHLPVTYVDIEKQIHLINQ